MAEKAKLKYEGLSYYDEDLEKIAKLFCKNMNCKYQKYTVDRILERFVIWSISNGKDSVFQIPLSELKNIHITLTNEKPIIDWPSSWGHFIYYRKDIWALADLVTKWNGFDFKSYKLDNRGKFLYLYFNHPTETECFIGVGYKDIETLKHALRNKDAKAFRMKANAWGKNIGF